MPRTALIQVLGAISYGEWKAYEGARAKAAAAVNDADRRGWRKVAAEELRHHKGFVARLEHLGADPERAMAPYREALDRYHAHQAPDPVEEAVMDYLGEGIADDLLRWLRLVVDADTARFVDTVLADEREHEGRAAAELRGLLGSNMAAHWRAGRAASAMLWRMVGSGDGAYPRFLPFLRMGRPLDLLGVLAGGYARRLRRAGIAPLPSVAWPVTG